MDIIKQKWKNYTLQKRLKDLWEEYLLISTLKDDPNTLQKFKIFLNQANSTLKEFIDSNESREKLEIILGDTGAVLDNILDYLNKFQELQNKEHTSETAQLIQEVFEQCLQLTEYILQDPKYRKIVQNSHNVLSEFLNLMEKAEKNESKVIVVKLLVLFSETVNQRVEFFEQQGFHRLLQTVMARDPQLSKVIWKALLHFLSVEEIQYVDLSLYNEDGINQHQAESIKSKISKIAVDFRKFACQELQRVFLYQQEQVKHEANQKDYQSQNYEDYSVSVALSKHLSYQEIFEADLSLFVEMQMIRSDTDEMQNDSDPIFQSDVIKEFQILQGGFKAILETLLKASDEVQYDLMKTIKKILFSNEKNKLEFKKINGYEFLNDLFNLKQNESLQFIQCLFQFLQDIIINNSQTNEIKDFDAFVLLMDLIAFQSNESLILIGYSTLQNLLHLNWKNILIAKRLKINYYLFILQLRLFLSSEDIHTYIMKCQNDYISTGFKAIIRNFNFNQIQNKFLGQSILSHFLQVAELEGLYNLETETIYSQFYYIFHQEESCDENLLTSLHQTLLSIINVKMAKSWSILYSLDHMAESLFKNLTQIYDCVYNKLANQDCLKRQNIIRYLLDLQDIINKFMNIIGVEQTEIQGTQPHFIQNIASQNRQEQFNTLLQIPINLYLIENKKGIKLFLDLFDFELEATEDLASQILKYRLNFVFLQSLSLLLRKNELFYQKFNQDHGCELFLYLIYSQYQLFNALRHQTLDNPIFDLASLALDIIDYKRVDYFIVLILFLNKCEMTDNCSTIVESLSKLTLLPDFVKNFKNYVMNDISPVQFVLLRTLNSIPKYINYLNLYASLLQLTEHILPLLSSEDFEVFLDSVLNGDNYKRQDEIGFQNGLCDILSIIAIHGMMQNGQGLIFEKIMMQSEYLTNILGLMEWQNMHIKQQSFKLVALFLILNLKVKKSVIYTQKTRVIQLIQKLMIFNDKLPFSNQLCNTIYKFIFWSIDSYHLLFPEGTSQVSSIMNRSQSADILLKAQKQHLEQATSIQKIINTDFLEIFFLSLTKNKQSSFRQDFLKVIESILDTYNIQIFLDVPNFIQYYYPFFASEFQKEKEICLNIITKVIAFDLQRTSKQSRTVDLLKKITDFRLMDEIIKTILQQVIDNPVLKGDPQNLLKNLQGLILNLEELVGYNESINVQVLYTINLLASKNSPEVRSALKSLNLFEVRDQLVFQILRYNLEPEILIQVLGGISFNQFCQQKQFKETHTMAFLIRKLIQHQNHFGLQMLIIKILKYDVIQSEENQKYVAKLLSNEHLITFFYPNLIKKQQRNFRCLQSKSNDSVEQSNQFEGEDDKKIQRSPQPKDSESEEKISSLSPQSKNVLKLGPNSTIEDFLTLFYSPQYDVDRKQIDLHLDKVLIPVESEFLKSQARINSKKHSRVQRLNEAQQVEQLATYQMVNEWELKIQLKLKKSQEKTKSKQIKLIELAQQRLEQGEESYFRICHLLD